MIWQLNTDRQYVFGKSGIEDRKIINIRQPKSWHQQRLLRILQPLSELKLN